MTDHYERSEPTTLKPGAGEVLSKASALARETGAKAKEAVGDAAETASEQVKEILDRQIASVWNIAGQFAGAIKRAADEIDQSSPRLAGVVRDTAGRFKDYAEEMEDQTVEQIMRSAADFTRRQPAVVFGVGAVVGFFIFRAIKSVPNSRSTKSARDA